jgi:hypothetical protein
MIKAMSVCLAFAGATMSAVGQIPRSEPAVSVCLDTYARLAKEARYRVTVTWNGFDRKTFSRIDIGADDSTGATWPQFRDNRLLKGGGEFIDRIVVSDASQYPLVFRLVGFDAGTTKEFDEQCRKHGFCSVRLPNDGLSEIGLTQTVVSPTSAPACN